jgi:hypothetical protein
LLRADGLTPCRRAFLYAVAHHSLYASGVIALQSSASNLLAILPSNKLNRVTCAVPLAKTMALAGVSEA